MICVQKILVILVLPAMILTETPSSDAGHAHRGIEETEFNACLQPVNKDLLHASRLMSMKI